MPLYLPQVSLSRWNNFGIQTGAGLQATNLTASTRSIFVFPLDPLNEVFPGNMYVSTMRFLIDINASTASVTQQHTFAMYFGLYRISASNSQSTLSLVNSAMFSYTRTTLATSAAANSFSGTRWVEFTTGHWSSTPYMSAGVRYIGAWAMSWSSISYNTLNIHGGSNLSTFNHSGTLNAASASNTSRGWSPYAGIYTATSGGMPASIHVSQLNKQAANANWTPFVEFDNLYSVR